MEKLNIITAEMAEKNIEMLGQMFPNCLTEKMNEEGKIVKAIDFDKLRQELADSVVEGPEERYQFTWPDKRNAIRLANSPTTKTLRPCREESVDFDNTQNLYIEGDNLDVLKILRENYLGKVKMIYIDPPYNTGSDTFVYDDDFSISIEDFSNIANNIDEDGNILYDIRCNNETNGRFHTDWLNMIYPRLKVAKDLLSDNGVIFISIDGNEVENMKKICNEIFGEINQIGIISNINNPKGRSDDKYLATANEYVIVFAKSIQTVSWFGFEPTEEITRRYNKKDKEGKRYREIDLRKTGENDLREDRPNLFYYFYYNELTGDFYPSYEDKEIDGYIKIKPQREDIKEGNWRWGLDTAKAQISMLIPKFMPTRKVWGVMQKDYLEGRDLVKPTSSWTFKDVNSERGTEEFINLGFDKRVFPKPKPIGTIARCCKLSSSDDDIILDFFSGSATTAHAVMKLNAEDGGNRKYIMVQLPEVADEKSEAYKAGYKNICEIGKERIRRAGKKVKEEAGLHAQSLDVGFRVLKLDSANEKEVKRTPSEVPVEQGLFDAMLEDMVENIKEDRTPEDLLFQVLPMCNLPLSCKIETKEIDGKCVFVVEDGYLVACFDENIKEEVIISIAKMKPYYFIMRDSSLATDNVADNFDQIFNAYSKDTIRRIL